MYLVSVIIVAIYFFENDFITKHDIYKRHYIRYNVMFLTISIIIKL